MKISKLVSFRTGSRLSFSQKFWSTGVDQSVDFRIYEKYRGKNELIL